MFLLVCFFKSRTPTSFFLFPPGTPTVLCCSSFFNSSDFSSSLLILAERDIYLPHVYLEQCFLTMTAQWNPGCFKDNIGAWISPPGSSGLRRRAGRPGRPRPRCGQGRWKLERGGCFARGPARSTHCDQRRPFQPWRPGPEAGGEDPKLSLRHPLGRLSSAAFRLELGCSPRGRAPRGGRGHG